MDKKVYPTAEELTKINSIVHCTEEGCNSVFSSESNLTLHLVKTHKKEHLLKSENVVKQFHCPTLSCIYNSNKSFKNLKLLKQHYLKVHSERHYICDVCNKGFPTQSTKNNHAEYCGILFKCIDCEASYPSYESLLTHARRKKHAILEKATYKPGGKSEKSTSSVDVSNKRKGQYILPKGSISLQLITVKPDGTKVMNDKSNQTDYEVAKNSDAKKLCLNHSSSQTHGLTLQKSHSSAETQTMGDYISKKSSLNDFCSSSDDSLSRKSIKTQTKLVSSTTKSCNTSFNLTDLDFDCDVKVERNSSATQTVTTVPAEFIYSTTMDASKDLNFDMEALDADNFFNCNTETQTDFISGIDFMSLDYYSDMYTQTCDDLLLNDLGFNNTHTQTVFDEMLRSVESQTMMSQGSKTVMSCRDMAHMETQTDAAFKQILEEINA